MRMLRILPLLLMSLMAFAEGKKLMISEETKKELGLNYTPVEIRIEGLKRDYLFIWLSDLHVIADDMSEAAEKDLNILLSRRDKSFLNRQTKQTALWLWNRLPECLNVSGADAILLGGDICDVGALANVKELQAGFKKFTVPYMYTRADHDVSPWWLKDDKERKAQLAVMEKEIDGNEDMMVIEYEDLIVAGFNMSTSNLTKKGLEKFREIYAKNKPIILVSHVPLNSPLDPSFGEACMNRDSAKRNLTWGEGCYYKPNAETKALLDLVYEKDSHVKAVLGGHLHCDGECQITPTVYQHIFKAAFNGTLGIISVKAK